MNKLGQSDLRAIVKKHVEAYWKDTSKNLEDVVEAAARECLREFAQANSRFQDQNVKPSDRNYAEIALSCPSCGCKTTVTKTVGSGMAKTGIQIDGAAWDGMWQSFSQMFGHFGKMFK